MNSVLVSASGSPLSGSAEALRLNLGGRETKIPGFQNVDLQEFPSVDVHADIRKLPFEDGEVDEIYASHLLEHFSWSETDAILLEWRRVLRAGGVAYISVPDYDAMQKIYRVNGLCQYVVEVLMGEHHNPFGGHMNLFNFPRLAAYLTKAGFSDVQRIKWMPYGVKDCSQMMDNIFMSPISISVKAVA
jgi:SAM-dependent methyltransferase